VVIRGNY
jgi:hypothetical protein